jgi:hypothetical protein
MQSVMQMSVARFASRNPCISWVEMTSLGAGAGWRYETVTKLPGRWKIVALAHL